MRKKAEQRLKSGLMIRDSVPRALFSSAKSRKVVLMSKAKSLQSKEQMTHQQKRQCPDTDRVAARLQRVMCTSFFLLARFLIPAKRGKTDNRQQCVLRFLAAEVSKI